MQIKAFAIIVITDNVIIKCDKRRDKANPFLYQVPFCAKRRIVPPLSKQSQGMEKPKPGFLMLSLRSQY